MMMDALNRALVAGVCWFALASPVAAQAPATLGDAFLSETASVNGASRTLFIWGVGSEEEESTAQYAPEIRHRGDFSGQCRYTMSKVEQLLATRGASLADVTTLRVYVIDARDIPALHACLDQYYSAAARPALTVTPLYQLAHAGMMVEIEATASLPTPANAGNYSVYRNTETQGRWNVGAIEVLDVSGPSRTFYVSGLRAVERGPSPGLVSMFPHDFVSQCQFVHRRMNALLTAQGATTDSIVRTTAYVGGEVLVGDLFGCRAHLSAEYLARAPGSLAGMTQLGVLGESYIYDILAIAPLRRGESARRFTRTIVPSAHDPLRPDAIVVVGPRRTITIFGADARNAAGHVQFPGDFANQCRLAFGEIDALLAQRGAALGDLVKLLVLISDNRHAADFDACTDAVFGDRMQPAQTIVAVPRPSEPGVLVQIEAIAAIRQ